MAQLGNTEQKGQNKAAYFPQRRKIPPQPFKLEFLVPIRTVPKASLVQREVSAEQADGGIDAAKCMVFASNSGEIVTSYCTTPQSEIYDF